MSTKINYNQLFDDNLKREITELKDAIAELGKGIDSISKKAIKVKINTEQSGKAYESNKKAVDELTEAEKLIIEQQREQEKLQRQLLNLQAKKLVQDTEQVKNLERERQLLNERKKALRENIAQEKVQAGSIEALQKENNKLIKQRKQLDLTSAEGKKQFDELTKAISNNNTKLLEYDKQIKLHQRNVGNYSSALDKVRTVFTNLAGAAGIVGIATASFVGFDKKITETAKIQSKLRFAFGTTGKELQYQTALIQSLASFYETDYNEVLTAANALAKEFGISGSQSLLLIEQGFAKGANTSGEFLSILNEYPAQLKQVGFSADESIAIITQQVKEGIFSDKGIDAIKEAGIRLREMTPATKKALNDIGLVADNIQQGLADGTLKMTDVIAQVSEKMANFGDNSVQVGQVLADVFGGAGEDAGLRYLKMLKGMNSELEKMPATLDKFQQASLQLTKEWDLFMVSITNSDTALGGLYTDIKLALASLLQFSRVLSEQGVAGSVEFESALSDINAELTDTKSNIDILKSSLANIVTGQGLLVIGDIIDSVKSNIGSAAKETDIFNEALKRLASGSDDSEGLVLVLKEYMKYMGDLNTLTDEQIKLLNQYGVTQEVRLNNVIDKIQRLETSSSDNFAATESRIEKLKQTAIEFAGVAENAGKITAEQIAFFKDEYGINLDEISAKAVQLAQVTQAETEAIKQETTAVSNKIPEIEALAESETNLAESMLLVRKEAELQTPELIAPTFKDANKDFAKMQASAKQFADVYAKMNETERQAKDEQLTNIQQAISNTQTLTDAYGNLFETAGNKKLELTNQILASNEQEIASLNERYNIETDLAKKGVANDVNNIRIRLSAKQAEQQELQRIAKEQAEKQKRLQKALITANYLLELSYIAVAASQNILNGVTLGSAGAAQYLIQAGVATARYISNLQAINSVGFAKGTEYVTGQGTATSDSINAKLSVGERVVPADINAQMMGVPNQLLPTIIQNGISELNDARIVSEIKRTNYILQDKMETTKTGQHKITAGNLIKIR